MAESIQDIPGVGPSTESDLNDAGINDLTDIAKAGPDYLVDNVGMSNDKAKKMVKVAKQSTVLINTATDVEAEYERGKKVSMGLGPIDEYLGGGLEEGFVLGLTGVSGTGKTQLSFQMLVNAVVQTRKPALYVESEHRRFRPERIRELCPDDVDEDEILNLINVIQATSLDQLYSSYEAMMKQFDEMSIVIIDSFTGVFRMSGQFDDRQNFSERSNVMAKHFRKLYELVEDLSCPVVVTGQIFESPDAYGRSDIPWGGSLFLHEVTFMLKTKPGKGDTFTLLLRNHPGKEDQDYILEIGDDIVIQPD